MKRTEEVAWAAGLFEGEGFFTLDYNRPRKDGTRRCRALAGLAMADKATVEKFGCVIGFGFMSHSYKAGHKGQLTYWRWNIRNGERVQRLLSMFEPFLSPRRIARAYEVLEANGTYV